MNCLLETYELFVTLSCGLTTYQGHWETLQLAVTGNHSKSLEIIAKPWQSFEVFLEIK